MINESCFLIIKTSLPHSRKLKSKNAYPSAALLAAKNIRLTLYHSLLPLFGIPLVSHYVYNHKNYSVNNNSTVCDLFPADPIIYFTNRANTHSRQPTVTQPPYTGPIKRRRERSQQHLAEIIEIDGDGEDKSFRQLAELLRMAL
jgi:hypothetical protein